MPRHRAPTNRRRVLGTFGTLALTGAALSGSLLSPAAASAAPAPTHPSSTGAAGTQHRADDRSDDDRARPPRHRARTPERHRTAPRSRDGSRTRPMSSGERQYRNGCRKGYLREGCDQYGVKQLLRRGINPYL